MTFRDQTLGEIAAKQPGATRVLLRHRLDFCCGGGRTLAAACAQAGLDADAIARELDGEPQTDEIAWDTRPAWELMDHIESRYHATLRRDVPPLLQAARKVERVHAQKPAVPAGLAMVLTAFWDELQEHMQKEELVLFPALRNGANAGRVAAPIRTMMRDHDVHAAALRRVRELTDDLVAPAHACATWRALYDGLVELERELMEHIHLENHVLFARAAA